MTGFISTIFGDVPKSREYEWEWVENHFDPLKELYQTEGVTEIFVDRFDSISIERNGVIEKTNAHFKDEKTLVHFVEQLGIALVQPFDEDSPVLDARLPDCSRLCCTLPQITPQGATLTLRIAPKSYIQAEQLVKFGAMNQAMLDYLIEVIQQGLNILVSGNTGSGKTTLLRALARYIPKCERIVTCEDTQELYLDWLPFKVSMEAPKRKGTNIEMKNLIEAALRMRPDRIWVGEIRKSSAADAFLQAINTGHSGCATTLHANSSTDAVSRLQYLIASQGNISYELARKQITDNVDVFIHASRDSIHGRKVMEINKVIDGNLVPIFTYDKENQNHTKLEKE